METDTSPALSTYCTMNTDTENDAYNQIVTRLSKLCRICGDPVQNGVNIFGKKGAEISVKDKIETHMPIRVALYDALPQQLCMDCYQKLEAVHNLVVTCLKTDIRFRRYLNINVDSPYDNKFIKIAQECSAEVIKELRPRDDDKLNSSSTDFISQLNNNDLTDLFVELKNNEECPKIGFERSEKKLNSSQKLQSESVICCNCNDIFECNEMFENHKILCSVIDEFKVNEENGKCNVNNININNNNNELNVENEKMDSLTNETFKKRRCGHCKAEYLSRKHLHNHINEIHSGKQLFMCGSCDKVYVKWSGLDIHEATHRTDKPYLCDLCGKSFKHSNNLRGHKRIHLDETSKKRHVCHVCDKRFRSRFHLAEHINSHNENRPYSCEECGKSFFKRVQLRQHKLSHGSNKFACLTCGVTFNRRGNMIAHTKTHNKGDAIYTCSVCESKCKTMSELKMHRKQHTETDIVESIKRKKKPIWGCKVCPRIFTKQALLLAHERAHTSSKKASQLGAHTTIYKCSTNFAKHINTHSNVSFICQHCGELFSRKATLNIHETTHVALKPYACDVCDKTFVQKNDMTRHMRLQHTQLSANQQNDNKYGTRNEAQIVHSYVMVPQIIDSITLSIVQPDQIHVVQTSQSSTG